MRPARSAPGLWRPVTAVPVPGRQPAAAGYGAAVESSFSGHEGMAVEQQSAPPGPEFVPSAAGRGRGAAWLLEQEALALLTRLRQVRPFALQETMLPAAALTPTAQVAIERCSSAAVAGCASRSWRSCVAPRSRPRARRPRRPSAASPSSACASTTSSRSSTCSRSDLAAERERDRRLAIRPRRVGRRRSLLARAVTSTRPRSSATSQRGPGAAIRRARTRAARRRRRTRSRSSGAARADGRARHRIVARPRGRPPGGGTARPRRVASARAGAQRRAAPERTVTPGALAALDLGGGRRPVDVGSSGSAPRSA